MPTEDYGAWFQFDLVRFLATPALDLKQIFLSIYQRNVNMINTRAPQYVVLNIMHFLVSNLSM